MSYSIGAQEMRNIAKMVDERLRKTAGKQIGFVVLTFDFETEGQTNYISNGRREDMIKYCQEMVDKWTNENDKPTFEEN